MCHGSSIEFYVPGCDLLRSYEYYELFIILHPPQAVEKKFSDVTHFSTTSLNFSSNVFFPTGSSFNCLALKINFSVEFFLRRSRAAVTLLNLLFNFFHWSEWLNVKWCVFVCKNRRNNFQLCKRIIRIEKRTRKHLTTKAYLGDLRQIELTVSAWREYLSELIDLMSTMEELVQLFNFCNFWAAWNRFVLMLFPPGEIFSCSYAFFTRRQWGFVTFWWRTARRFLVNHNWCRLR